MFSPAIVFRKREQASGLAFWQGSVQQFWISLQKLLALLVVTPPDFDVEDVVSSIPGARATPVIRSDDGTYFIVERDRSDRGILTVYDNPLLGSQNCAPSPPSDARYRARYSRPYFGVYDQLLARPRGAPYGRTSCHYHTVQYEWWYVLRGCGVFLTRDITKPDAPWVAALLSEGMVVSVAPLVAHQLWTKEELSTCLVMSGHPKGICHDDHHYLEEPPVAFAMA